MNILLVGGTGMVSGALARAFVEANHTVVIITDGCGTQPAPDGIRAHLIADRNDAGALERALREAPLDKWDAVVDAVAFNAQGASALVAALRPRRPHAFVISTSFVYSTRARQPISPAASHGSLTELGGYAFERHRWRKCGLRKKATP